MIFSITLLIKVQVFSTSHNSTASSCMCCQRITSHLISWDARTRLQRRRTRVRCGDVRGTSLTTRRCHICHMVSFFFLPTCTNAAKTRPDLCWIGLICADSGRIGWNHWNGLFKLKRPIQAEIQTLSLTPSLISLICALCDVRVLGFIESLSTSLSLLSISGSPEQHNTNATLLARDKELQYKKTLITPKCPLLCILLDP